VSVSERDSFVVICGDQRVCGCVRDSGLTTAGFMFSILLRESVCGCVCVCKKKRKNE